VLLDGDTLPRAQQRSRLSAADRSENIRRLAEAPLIGHTPHIAIVAAVHPSTESAAARRICDTAFRKLCRNPCRSLRAPRSQGHYAKARAGALQAFTRIGRDYQPPTECE